MRRDTVGQVGVIMNKEKVIQGVQHCAADSFAKCDRCPYKAKNSVIIMKGV